MATSAWSEAGVSEWAGRGMERLAAGWPDLAALVSRTGNNAVLESGVSLSRAAPAQGAGLAVGRRAGGRRGSARRARTGSRGTGARWRVRARRVPARSAHCIMYTHVPSCVASDVCGGGPRKATRKIQKRDFSHASRRSATLAARPGPQTLVYTSVQTSALVSTPSRRNYDPGWAGAARTQIGTTPIADAVPMRGDGTGGCGRCALARVSNLVSLAP